MNKLISFHFPLQVVEEEDSATIVLGEKQPIQIDKHILPIKEQKSEHGVSDSLIQDNIDSLVKNVAELDILKLDIKNPTTKVKKRLYFGT